MSFKENLWIPVAEGSKTSTIIYLSIIYLRRRAQFFHGITEVIYFLIGNLITLMKKLLNSFKRRDSHMKRNVITMELQVFNNSHSRFLVYWSTKSKKTTAAVVAVVRAFALHVESWVFESQSQQVVKTGSDSSTVKRSTTGVSVTGPQGWPL